MAPLHAFLHSTWIDRDCVHIEDTSHSRLSIPRLVGRPFKDHLMFFLHQACSSNSQTVFNTYEYRWDIDFHLVVENYYGGIRAFSCLL